jgi:4-amino-4-deoxy-L-arabinose transferase-like glycosyltransferase
LLTLFLFLANLEFLKFILNEQKKHLLWFFLFITLAFATKLYASLLFAPAYFILLLVFRKLKRFIFNVHFTVGILFFLFVSGFIIYFRELDSKGYIDIILGKDAGRIFSIVEGHSGSWSFYLESLSKERFSIWFIPLIAGAFLNIFNPHEQQKNQNISTTNQIDFQVDDKVLMNGSNIQKIENKYDFTVIDSTEFVKVVVINEKLE